MKQKHNTRLVFDPSYPDIDYHNFHKYKWTEFYGDSEEAIPADMTKPLGKEVDLRMFFNSDHAGDKKTRRSRTGFLIFFNMALIDWVPKKKPAMRPQSLAPS